MAAPGREVARRDDAALVRRGDQRDLGQHFFPHIAHAGPFGELQADRLQSGFQFEVGVEFLLAFVPGLAQRFGGNEDQRSGKVDEGDLDAVDDVAALAGREQAPGLGAGGVLEIQLDRRTAAGDAVDPRRSVIGDLAARGLDERFDDFLGVDVEDAQRGDRVAGRHQAVFDGERADAGKHVAAVGRGVYGGCFHGNLGEQVIDIDPGSGRFTDDDDLAGQGVAAADAVDLPDVRRAHDGEQQLVAQDGVAGQVAGVENTAPSRCRRASGYRGC